MRSAESCVFNLLGCDELRFIVAAFVLDLVIHLSLNLATHLAVVTAS